MTEAKERLNQVLDGSADTDAEMDMDTPAPMPGIVDEVVAPGMCVECGDTPARVSCEQCTDDYCDLCFKNIHRRGKRTRHNAHQISNAVVETSVAPGIAIAASIASPAPSEDDEVLDSGVQEPEAHTFADSEHTPAWFAERTKCIPLRLSFEERKKLRLVEGALNVSEYTDKVDIVSYKSKAGRMHAQILEMCAILSGLMVASDYKRGQQLLQDREFSQNAEFFRDLFEVARRYKIMNPEKMRTDYGKLLYLLMDSVSSQVQDLLQFSVVAPIRTVYSLLEESNGLALLNDPLMPVATAEILPFNKSRQQVQSEIRRKEAAVATLARKYSSSKLKSEEIELCLHSIGDNHSFLTGNRLPVDMMLHYLTTMFSPDAVDGPYSLAIQSGHGGARLSHSHTKQFHYVNQSLTLWREVLHDMFRLWCLAEEDMLSPDNRYRLTDTGQGLQRVQAAPRVARAMQQILGRAQARIGSWVGSSVVHLGDHNVPNALMFIDKYTQISRFLNPVVITCRAIDSLDKDPALHDYLTTTFGSADNCRKEILCDFFRHGFDGSGADNFYDAGSCIDGRLTSAWNWCGMLEKKRYYHVFKLAGFTGFDGEFK
eukprot:TRINITY_DN6221_c0_g1_i1.p1 TRINITY_DN6221_c0_g1~~TRINITY_DN6221_c0_g1_i1.p1  ORF type:complete len:623 (+),score=139.53 TRINITY_DN6221_c0_g1_i1:75-1871(+)